MSLRCILMSDSKEKIMTQSKKVRRIVLLSMFVGIELVLMTTPLGFVPIGPIKATTLHIPVIVLSILLGVKEGAILGAVFGFSSIMMSTFQPSAFSFCFSPFYSIGELHGNFGSVIIAMVPRICIGLCSGLLYQALSKKTTEHVAIVISSISASLINTILVMSGIWLFFGRAYAQTAGFAYETFLHVIKLTICTNGLLEAILAAVVSLAIIKALKMKGVSL